MRKLNKRIWLIGGTQESGILAVAIARAQIPCTVTVTTETARSLYPHTPLLRVQVGRLNSAALDSFIQQEEIVAILDASHPYAVEVSKSAIAFATQRQIPYLRYERPELDAGTRGREDTGTRRKEKDKEEEEDENSIQNPKSKIQNSSPIIYLDNFDALLAGNYLEQQRVLLTIGYRPLTLFHSWQNRSTLFARLLPSVTAMEAALAAGFTPGRLIALRPPIPTDLEKALWRHWQISLVVTKASGTAGGEDIKRTVASELGIPLVVITRPDIDYPQQTSDLSTTLEFCRQHIFIKADS